MTSTAWWTRRDDGIVVRVRVTPGASRSEIIGVRDDQLAVRVRGRAVEGQANAALIETIASAFGVRPRTVTIIGGEHSRNKTVRIDGVIEPPPTIRSS
jgi:uncharacterized protein